MRKTLHLFGPLLAAGVLTASFAVSDAKHLVLHEKFTNTGCGPCARFAPASDSLLYMRLGEVIPITYHGNYPQPSDEFYLSMQDANDARIAQYGVTGYPSVFLNGKEEVTSVDYINRTINEMLQEEQVMDLKLETHYENGILQTKVTATPIQLQNNANLRLFVCAVEDVVYPKYPVPNKQTEFHYEARHFMHEPQGVDLGAFTDFTPATFEEEWQVTGFDNVAEMSVVAWLQDVATGEVIECAYAPKSNDVPDAARVLMVEDTPDRICSPFWHATVTFRNIGYEKLTECNICMEINGKVQKTPWRGELEYLGRATVTTPDFTDFDIDPDEQSYMCAVYLDNINGTDARSEEYRIPFSHSVVGKRAIEVTLYTDNKPQESAWTLYDVAGNVLETSEPFTEKRHFYKHVFDLPSDGCYTLRFTDAGGDGIVGQYGNGYYKLSQINESGKASMITQGDYNGAEKIVSFALEDAVAGVETVTCESLFDFNQATKVLQVNAADAEVRVIDASGIVVKQMRADYPCVDCSSLPAGVYVVNVVAEGSTTSRTFRF